MNPFVLTRIDPFDHLVPETQHTAILSQVIELALASAARAREHRQAVNVN
jgi:hypothetical protein